MVAQAAGVLRAVGFVLGSFAGRCGLFCVSCGLVLGSFGMFFCRSDGVRQAAPSVR